MTIEPRVPIVPKVDPGIAPPAPASGPDKLAERLKTGHVFVGWDASRLCERCVKLFRCDPARRPPFICGVCR